LQKRSRKPPRPRREPLADLHEGDLPDRHAGLLTGFALAFARALGEYGSVIFIAGNMPWSARSRRL
jgi:ABC-type molybdate transport system permease subunit